ncbi:MAG: class I SAM-dependent methyltransferase [Aestuariibacter sp.]
MISSPIILANPGSLSVQDIEKSLTLESRTEQDRARDPQRKPEQVLALMGLKPGMTVLDINAGEGYYSEILSPLVGKSGKVIRHNDPTYTSFMNEESFQARYGDGRLSNIEHYHSKQDALDLEQNSVDAAIMALSFHDYFFKHESRGKKISDPAAVAASIHHALKPGATLIVIDHVGQPDGSLDDWHKMHRIAPSLAEYVFISAGFKLVKEADILVNKDDPLTVSPFDPSIRGSTNRFVHVYIKD